MTFPDGSAAAEESDYKDDSTDNNEYCRGNRDVVIYLTRDEFRRIWVYNNSESEDPQSTERKDEVKDEKQIFDTLHSTIHDDAGCFELLGDVKNRPKVAQSTIYICIYI